MNRKDITRHKKRKKNRLQLLFWGILFAFIAVLVLFLFSLGGKSIVRELNRIGNNINQIAAKQHSHGFVDEPMLREAVASLQRMEREFTRAFAQES